MPIIHFATPANARFVVRQTPRGDGIWQEMHFVFDADKEDPDWLVVQDSPPKGLLTTVPRHRRIVILAEPPSIRSYDDEFIRQFGIVVAATPPDRCEGIVFESQPAVPWFYGVDLDRRDSGEAVLGFDRLAAGREQRGERGLLSAVCSTKTLNLNQVRRLRFLEKLKSEIGNQLTVFGRGFQRIGDKAHGLDGFRYHLVLENNLDPNAWTEKLADPILAGVYPIFAGGPALEAYFDPHGFTAIDIRRPQMAIRQVLDVLESDPVSRPEVQAAMAENRRRLMEEHQFFPLISKIVRDLPESSDRLPAPVPIRGPRKPKWRHFVRPLRPLRAPISRVYLALCERG